MIGFNLISYQESMRGKKVRIVISFFWVVLLMALVVFIGVFIYFKNNNKQQTVLGQHLQGQLQIWQQKNYELNSVEQGISKIQNLNKMLILLKQRQELQNQIFMLLNEVTSNEILFNSITMKNNHWTITGNATDSSSLNRFVEQLKRGELLRKIEISEIKRQTKKINYSETFILLGQTF